MISCLAVVGLIGGLVVGAQAQTGFSDDFKSRTLNTAQWSTATYPSPDSKPGINNGVYAASAIDFEQGILRITVHQSKGNGVNSTGGALISKDLFGFGTYEFEMRMSSTSPTPQGKGEAVTGAVSSGFIYYNKSESEIDLEFLGNENAMWVSTWRNPNPTVSPTSLDKTSKKIPNGDLSAGFHQYKLVWTPEFVDVSIDGTQVSHQTEHVPHAAAHIILQHRGTNSDKWGGVATIGVDRYFFVRSVKFTPAGR
jgi:beta-glucanase (GH16 family)